MVDFTIPQIMMTLAAIAYTEPSEKWWQVLFCGQKNPTAEQLETNLATPSYATNGDWKLVWGPADSPDFDNMMFVTRQSGTDTYALVLRGTVFDDLASWKEDLATDQKRFNAYTNDEETWVANGFFDGFNLMLQATSRGPAQDQTLSRFFEAEASTATDMTIYVTGHSQGAGLMPLFLAWLNAEKNRWGKGITTAGYGFAPPTAGDQKFADWVEQNADSNLYINPYDLVPFGYRKIDRVIPDAIPTEVPEILHPVIDAAVVIARDAANTGGGSWAQAGKQVILDGTPATGSYFDQIGFQHGHNTYLKLLGATPTSTAARNFAEAK